MDENESTKKKTKQVILFAKNFILADGTTITYKQLHRGKIATQVAHASVRAVLLTLKSSAYNNWIHHSNETKITLGVENGDELLRFFALASEKKVPVSKVIDAGHTEWKGQSMLTAVAIGPWWSDEIDAITGSLPLL